MQYYETNNNIGWTNLPFTVSGSQLVGYFGPASGFPISANYDATSQLRVTFAHAGNYPAKYELFAVSSPGTILSSFESTANVYNLPSLSSADLANPYVVGQSRDFHITLQNPAPDVTYSKALVRFAITAQASDVAALQYYETFNNAGWTNLPYTVSGSQLVGVFGPAAGFPVSGGYNATSSFRVTFASSGSFPVTFKLVDLSTTPETSLSTYAETAVVQDLPAISSANLAGPYVIGKKQEFQVQLQSSSNGKPYSNVRVKFAVPGAKAADLTSIEYYETYKDTGWSQLPLTETANGLEGYFGPETGFPLPANYEATSDFRVTFVKAGAFQVQLTLVDVSTTPETPVATYETVAQVYSLPVLSSTNLAGSYVAGKAQEFQVRLQNPSPVEVYNNMRVRFELTASAADIAALKYYETYNNAGWRDLPFTASDGKLVGFFGPDTGFPVAGGYDATSRFMVTFAKAGAYPVKFDLVSVAAPNTSIAAFATTANAYDVPALSSNNLVGPYVITQAKEFQVRLLNPAPDVTYNKVRIKFAITAGAADISSLKYYETYNDTGWLNLPYTVSGSDLTGYFGPDSGFPVAGGYDATSRFMVTFAKAGSYPVKFSLVDITSGETVLSTYQDTAAAYDLPVISSADLPGPFMKGQSQLFHVALYNPAPLAVLEHARVKFEVTASAADVTALQYYETYQDAGWMDLPFSISGNKLVGYFGPESGFPITANYEAVSQFRITFAKAGSYPVTFSLVDMDAQPETTVSSYSGTAAVQELPAISSTNLVSPYVIGKQQGFEVQLQSSQYGKPFSNVRVKFEVPGAKASDLASLEYYESYNNSGWLPLPLTETSTGLEGYFGPETGFPLPASYNATSQFRVTFAKTGDYMVKLTLVDVSTTPETALTSYEATASVYGLPTLSSTNLGASYIVNRQQEFQVRLQNPAPLAALDHALVKFELTAAAADITSLQYYETYQDAGWTDLPFTASGDKLVGVFGPGTGFPISASYDATSRFRVTFAKTGAYPVKFSLVDVAAPDTAIASYSGTANVYDLPGLSSLNLAGPYLVTKPQEFQVRLQNPAPDVDYSKTRVKFTITAKAKDIAALQYYETYQNAGWTDLPFTASGNKLVGYFGPETGFPVTGGYDAISRFMVTFASYGDFPVTFELVDISSGSETVLASYSGAAGVKAIKIFMPIVNNH